MSKEKLYKLQGEKIIPVNRFNLKPSSPSLNFENVKTGSFSVIKHPVVSSINFKTMPVMHFPFIENTSNITSKSTFKEFGNSKLQLKFPEVELLPRNGTLFYYENVYDKSGEIRGYLGSVTLKYNIKKPKKSKIGYIDVKLKQAILNLKVGNNENLSINGIVNEEKKEITFKLKDEAVKIAFANLTSKFEKLIPDIDLFFNFKGYSKPPKNSLIFLNFTAYNKLNLKTISLKNSTAILNASLLTKVITPKLNILPMPLIASAKTKS